ncbi:DNA-packaging protein [Mesorhizobium sp. M4B.F.Ca.ET.058.02.1.1]|uniref:DNA-packaging protein n=1 Tax=Mesorhizobium sp. M4B.F.Ca.ET.058.02.1.1 TaxID=2493675 RepID=UPI000F761622|nr:DNA-packaging protein [Mesorhizobium sp. M4B.F.Ca.ET.058.02.1.1]AZO51239.1 DNA-packaging protein [Mesorhizobium sp. M4B.F.Ca.ET.058.02.1.1]
MAAPKRNQFWKARSSHGRNPIFSTPDQLWEAACEYFEWVGANPLWEAKPFAYKGKVKIQNVAKMRAMTIDGLCIFLDIARRTWDGYCQRNDFLPVTTRVAEIIFTQKFEGASADLLNANIIARDLGLADKTELQGKGGGPLVVQVLKLSEADADDPASK